MEDDDELERIRTAYEKGEMESGEMKTACTKELQAYVSGFRERRAKVTEAVREEFMRPRQLLFRGMPSASEQATARKIRIEKLETELALLREENEKAAGSESTSQTK